MTDLIHTSTPSLVDGWGDIADASQDDALLFDTNNGPDEEYDQDPASAVSAAPDLTAPDIPHQGVAAGGSAQSLIRTARSQLGYQERRNNDTKYGVWYGMNHQPWCAMFVSWCAAQSGARGVIPRHAYTPAGANWFKARGQWVTSGYQPGDIVYFVFPGANRICHVGIVEQVQGTAVLTIEGNTHHTGGPDGVWRQRRRRYIVGAGRPRWGQITRPVPSFPLAEDGDLGPATVSALQAALHVAVDGQFGWSSPTMPDLGPVTTTALQRRITAAGHPVSVDGELGGQTVRGLQSMLNDLGTNAGVVDGQWGAETTRALQRALNRHLI